MDAILGILVFGYSGILHRGDEIQKPNGWNIGYLGIWVSGYFEQGGLDEKPNGCIGPDHYMKDDQIDIGYLGIWVYPIKLGMPAKYHSIHLNIDP